MSKEGLNGNKPRENSAYSDYKHYYCRCCGEPCINRLGEPATAAEQCKRCYHVPASGAGSGSRSAVRIVCGGLQESERRERAEDGQRPGPRSGEAASGSPECSERSAASERPPFRSERPERGSRETYAIGDALSRLAYRRGDDE